MSRPAIRTMVVDDHAPVVDLHVSAFGDRHNPQSQISEFYRNLVTRCGVDDDNSPTRSLVADKDDQLVAMVFGAPVALQLNDAPVTAKVATLLATRSGNGDMTLSRRLLSEFFGDAVDLVLADRANSGGRRAAERSGMVFYPQYSLRWARVISPGRAAAAAALNRKPDVGRLGRRVLMGSARLTDAVTSRVLERVNGTAVHNRQRVVATELSADDLAADGGKVLSDFRLRPRFASAADTAATWRSLEMLRSEGSHHRVAIRSCDGELVAWYLLHVWPSGTGEVVQFGSLPSHHAAALNILIEHAEQLQLGSLHGQAHPTLNIALSDAGAVFHGRGSSFGVYTRNPEVQEALTQSQAYITPLEGEYPLQLGRKSRQDT